MIKQKDLAAGIQIEFSLRRMLATISCQCEVFTSTSGWKFLLQKVSMIKGIFKVWEGIQGTYKDEYKEMFLFYFSQIESFSLKGSHIDF